MDKSPSVAHVPTPDGGYQLYKAAGKLQGRKALITGGDSGIGRSTSVLFAMEGADVFIVYLPEEEKDAQDTKKMVEENGQKCFLHPTDLRKRENCKAAVDDAIKQMGTVNILFNNHAYQMMTKSILDLPEDQWVDTFNTNIHRKLWTPCSRRAGLCSDCPCVQPSSTFPNTPCRT